MGFQQVLRNAHAKGVLKIENFVQCDTFAIQQRLLRLQLLIKSMSGEEIARELINVFSAQYGIPSNNLVASMHDCAACNGVALRTIHDC